MSSTVRWYEVLQQWLYKEGPTLEQSAPDNLLFDYSSSASWTGPQWLKKIVQYCWLTSKPVETWRWFWDRLVQLFPQQPFFKHVLNLPYHSSLHDQCAYMFMEKEDEQKKVKYIHDLLYAMLKSLKKQQDEEEEEEEDEERKHKKERKNKGRSTESTILVYFKRIHVAYNSAMHSCGVTLMLSDPVIRYLWCVAMELLSKKTILAEARVPCEVMDDVSTLVRHQHVTSGFWYSLQPFTETQKEELLKHQATNQKRSKNSSSAIQDDYVGLVFYDTETVEFICLFHQRLRWHHYQKWFSVTQEEKCTQQQKQEAFNKMKEENVFRARRMLRFMPQHLPKFDQAFQAVYRFAAVEQEDLFHVISKEPEVMFSCIKYDSKKQVFYVRTNREHLQLTDIESKSFTQVRQIWKKENEKVLEEPKLEFLQDS